MCFKTGRLGRVPTKQRRKALSALGSSGNMPGVHQFAESDHHGKATTSDQRHLFHRNLLNRARVITPRRAARQGLRNVSGQQWGSGHLRFLAWPWASVDSFFRHPPKVCAARCASHGRLQRSSRAGGWQKQRCPHGKLGEPPGETGGLRQVPIPEGNWYPVVVEVVVLVPGSIPERIQYATVDDWRMDCPWWIVLWIIL